MLNKLLGVYYKMLPHPARFLGDLQLRTGIVNYHEQIRKFVSSAPAGSRILDLGSGNRKLPIKDREIISFDAWQYEKVDVIGDGSELPFQSDTFDAVVLQQVLEHVIYPEQVLNEARRVLRPEGKIWIEVPFIYPKHGGEYGDFWRWTKEGLDLMCSRYFVSEENGTIMGSGASLSLINRSAWSALLSFGSRIIYHLVQFIVGWLTFWLKYLDDLTGNNTYTEISAPSVYFVGRKNEIK